MNPSRLTARSPIAIAGAFLVLGVAWIFVTDMIAARWFLDPRVQTVKGIVFVVGTAALLWGLLRIDRAREEKALERLRESEHRFRTLIENSEEIISILDADWRPLFRSAAYTRILGYRTDEVGSSVDLIHPDDRPVVEATFDRALEEAPRTVGPVEFRMRHKEGHWRLLEGTAMDLSHVPAVGGVVVNARDITERRAAEIRRHAAETRFRALIEHAQAGVWTCDPEGRTTYVNDKMAGMLGTEPEALLGRPAREFLSLERADEYAERMERRRRGEGDTTETEIVRSDGERIWVQISAGPLYDEDGEFEGVIGLVTDVTERRALEERLREKGRMEAVGRLAGGVAHDFNNLLTAIRGYGEVLRADFDEGDPRRERAGEIVAAADRAARLTDQLLAFGSRQMLEPRVLDPAEVVENAEPVLRNLLPETVELAIGIPDGLPAVRIDPRRIEEVLLHLVVNAHEAMPRGGTVRIDLEHVRLESDRRVGADMTIPTGEYVELAVEDSGSGMDDEVRRRAFDPFFTTKPFGQGTGLGLSSVYGLVRQSEGYVWVDDERDEGTTIRILLPVAGEAPEEEEDDDAGDERPGDAAPPESGELAVLVVEDEEAVRRLVATVLEGAGYRVLEAGSGREALDALDGFERSVDLVVTDVVMPDVGGEELAGRLRERWPGLGVLYVSGYADTGVAERLRGPSGDAFLAKPFTPDELIAAVEEMIGSPRASRR